MQENIIPDSVDTKDSTDNPNDLFNLIQSIQNKLKSDTSSEIDKEIPEVESPVKPDLNILSVLQNLDISSILGMLGGDKSSSNSTENSNFDLGNIDPKTIQKFSKILTSMKNDDPKKNLLISLKPFLRKTRQDKIGEYITILTLLNTFGIFEKKGSDKNV